MNWRGVRAVVRRDLRVAMASRAIVVPSIVIPAILLVGLPALAGLLPGASDQLSSDEVAGLLKLVPPDTLRDLPLDPGLRAAYVSVVYLLSPIILLVPVIFAAVIAADGIAGERERGTLEGLLLTPLTDREIATAKLLAAWIPGLVLGVGGAVVYAVVANLSVGVPMGRVILPTTEFAVMALWVGPMLAAAALGAVSLVSVRVATTQEAFQLGGLVVVPVMVMLVSQATGALLLSAWVLVVVGVVAAAAAAGLLALGTKGLARRRLGPRLE